MKAIALAANCAYLDKVETTIKSILYHVQKVKIYVFNYDIPQEWFIHLNQYVKQIGSIIIDQKFNPELVSNVHMRSNYINNLSYARFLIPEMLPEDRVLYLDSDLVVDHNIDELFNWPFDGNLLLAIPDFGELSQYNSGVMLFNNPELRKIPHLSQRLLVRGQNKEKASNGDQSVINQFFKGKIGSLPRTYNYQVGYDFNVSWFKTTEAKDILKIIDEIKQPKIVHFLTYDKPFNFISYGRMRDKWWSYRNLNWPQIIEKYTFYDPQKVGKQHFDGQVFIFTRSVDVQHLEELMTKLPHVLFNVAAYTVVAWRLIEDKKYPNYRLYPEVTGHTIQQLTERADVYLDINLGMKQEDVLQKINQRHLPFLAFASSAEGPHLGDNYIVFADNQVDEMAAWIKNFLAKNKRGNR